MPDEQQQQIAEKRQQLLRAFHQGRYEQAVPIAIEVRDLIRTAVGEDDPTYAGSLSDLGRLYQEMGDYARAEPPLRRAAEIRFAVLGEDHPEYATSLNNLAVLYQSVGHYTAAEPLYHQSLKILQKKIAAKIQPHAITGTGLVYQSMGHYTAAEPLYHQSLEIVRKIEGNIPRLRHEPEQSGGAVSGDGRLRPRRAASPSGGRNPVRRLRRRPSRVCHQLEQSRCPVSVSGT